MPASSKQSRSRGEACLLRKSSIVRTGRGAYGDSTSGGGEKSFLRRGAEFVEFAMNGVLLDIFGHDRAKGPEADVESEISETDALDA